MANRILIACLKFRIHGKQVVPYELNALFLFLMPITIKSDPLNIRIMSHSIKEKKCRINKKLLPGDAEFSCGTILILSIPVL